MSIYAVLNDWAENGGLVVDIIETDTASLNYVLLSVGDVIPDIGWLYDGANFISPPKPARSKLVLNIYQVVNLLTDDEYELFLDLDSYDKKETKLEKQKSVRVKRKRALLERSGDLPIAEFTAIAQVFVDEGVVTQARFDEILAILTV